MTTHFSENHKYVLKSVASHPLIRNAKLQRIKANLQSQYQFHIVWRKGKDHVLADGLSRAPVDDPDEDDEEDHHDHWSMTMSAVMVAVLQDDSELDGEGIHAE